MHNTAQRYKEVDFFGAALGATSLRSKKDFTEIEDTELSDEDRDTLNEFLVKCLPIYQKLRNEI